jgi:hypothetical protein
VNPLHGLADRLLLRDCTRLPSVSGVSRASAHRIGFTRGWTCCLLSVLACYVVYVAGLAILAPAS